jgi:IS30 family transposase
MYTHLTQNKRIELGLLLRLGYTARGAARQLSVSPSTISREIRRNSRPSGYRANVAPSYARERRARANAQRIKLLAYPELSALVTTKLQANWSPEQIAGWLKARGHRWQVCAQTIYDWCTGLLGTYEFTCTAARVSTVVPERVPYARPSVRLLRSRDALRTDQRTS